jgi:hypothetical protein
VFPPEHFDHDSEKGADPRHSRSVHAHTFLSSGQDAANANALWCRAQPAPAATRKHGARARWLQRSWAPRQPGFGIVGRLSRLLYEHSRCSHWHVDRHEKRIGVEVIISRLVNHTNQSLRIRVGIFDHLINLTDIEGSRMACILDTEDELESVIHAIGLTKRLTLISR